MIFVDEDNVPFNMNIGKYIVKNPQVILVRGGVHELDISRPSDGHLKILTDNGTVWCVDDIHNNQ
jgi:hypothetical protein